MVGDGFDRHSFRTRYYGVPMDVTYEGVSYEHDGMAFSKQIVTEWLRNTLGFNGYVNSDTGIINQRAWGLENKTVPERVAAAINAGIDLLSGFNSKQTIIDLVKAGLVSETRVGEAVKRLLMEQFALGLFEDPYVDANAANSIVGKNEFRQRALDAQRKSIVLLKNQNNNALPLRASTAARRVRLYTLGLNEAVVGDAEYGGYSVVVGNRSAATGNRRAPGPKDTDHVIIRVEVINPTGVTSTYPFGFGLTY